MRRLLMPLLTLALGSAPAAAWGHEVDSAMLSLEEIGSGSFSIYWHASSRTLQDSLDMAVKFPATCHRQEDRLDCGPTGLVGAIAFPWLEGSLTRVIVDVRWLDGTRLLRMATPNAPVVRFYGTAASPWRTLGLVVGDYAKLGIEHILTGFDHMLFVVALVLLVRRRAQLLATITAFTLAHSATLALTVLGLVHVPAAPVEASIALSILLVSAECLRAGESLTRRAPWAIAFAFGLLHGLGFASALLDLGLPERHVTSALVCFNLGVELGQLAVVASVIVVRALLARALGPREALRRAFVYAMGSLAAYWTLERMGTVFGFWV